jgi:hypothetical protein
MAVLLFFTKKQINSFFKKNIYCRENSSLNCLKVKLKIGVVIHFKLDSVKVKRWKKDLKNLK